MKIALLHDFLLHYGGAEKCLEGMAELYPDATVHTIAKSTALDKEILTNSKTLFPLARVNHRLFLPLYPFIMNRKMPESKIILSSSYAFVKNIKKSDDQLHICYCHTPARFLHGFSQAYIDEQSAFVRLVLRPLLQHMAKWDKKSGTVNQYIATCKNVQDRIKKYYKRESTIIHPFVDTKTFTLGRKKGSYYLFVGRLVLPYKKVDIAIQAANELKVPLFIIGSGRDESLLKKLAGKNVRFLGSINDEKELAKYYQRAKAVIFPSEDDFGMVPLEAQSCGTPVIAFGKGGALETVIEGRTGHFFHEQTPEALNKAIREFERMKFDPLACRKNALQFDKEIFKRKIKAFVDEKYREWKKKRKV